MADSVSASSLPVGFDLYAGYCDGRYKNWEQVQARFPTHTVLSIAVFPSTMAGDVLDVESGDATPAQAPPWVKARRAAGHRGPMVYCSTSVQAAVVEQFYLQEVVPPNYWLAAYPGPGPVLIGGYGHQWIDRGAYDESVMPDYLPGIDPAPLPVEPTKEQLVNAIVGPDGLYTVCAASPEGHLLRFTAGPDKWTVIDVTAAIEQTNPGSGPYLVAP